MARILVACERSGIVRRAFRERGHEAWSCDLVPADDGGEHIQGDVQPVLRERWDLVIAHPPCTYLSRARGSNIDIPGLVNGIEFFVACYQANAPLVAVENPTIYKVARRFLGEPDCVVEPYQFGDVYRKRTCLWLRGLPVLLPQMQVVGKHPTWINTRLDPGVARGTTERAQFWPGIAAAMADQWGPDLG